MAKNPLRIDPTRTSLLRRMFIADLNKRFKILRSILYDAVVRRDVFGLVERKPLVFMSGGYPITTNIEKRVWEFHTTDDKLKAFNVWFKQQVDSGILEVSRGTRPWLSKYVMSAYKKGAIRAYMDTHSKELAKSLEFYLGSKEQFLETSFLTPERVSKLKLLGTRTFEELKGVTATMSQQISRVLADGLAHGKGPYDIARTMSKTIAGIQRARANVIARTEIINAHSEGQLDAFEDLGVKEVGVMAEWLTAGDGKVCPRCHAMEGTILTVKKARGLIPLHPNCRCAWIPANVGEKRGPKSRRKLKKALMGIGIPENIS